MTRDLRITLQAAALLLLASTSFAQRGGVGGPSAELELDPAGPVEFGQIGVSSAPVTIMIELENNTAQDVEVDLPTVFGPFRILSGGGNYTLGDGESETLLIRYDPKYVGLDYVEMRVSPDEDLVLSLRGTGVASEDCGFDAPLFEVQDTEIGTPETVAVLVSNDTGSNKTFTFLGACNAFTVTSTNPITVAPSSSGSFTVEFDPDQEGSYVSQVETNCGSSTWLLGLAVEGSGKAPIEQEQGSTQLAMSVGPNPIREVGSIRYLNIGRATITAELRVVDLRGRVLRTQALSIPPGSHQWRWDGRDHAGESVAAGVYFIELVAPDNTTRQKVTVLR